MSSVFQRLVPHTVSSLPQVCPVGDLIELVGVVERESRGFLFLDFVLNDASGRIPIRYITPPAAWWDVPEFEGLYVVVQGRLSASDRRHIITESVRLVTDPNQISYHTIAVAHSILRARSNERPALP